MKKKLFVIFSLIIFLSLLTSCKKTTVTTTTKEKSFYDYMNEFVSKEQDNIVIDIISTQDDYYLEGYYRVKKNNNNKTIIYSCEELNPIEIGPNGIIVPESFKSLKEGYVVVKDNKIIEQNGETADIPFDKIDTKKFNFNKEYFNNIVNENGEFSCTVTDINSFSGWNSDIKDMRITLTHENNAINQLSITYKAVNGSDIAIYYIYNQNQ